MRESATAFEVLESDEVEFDPSELEGAEEAVGSDPGDGDDSIEGDAPGVGLGAGVGLND